MSGIFGISIFASQLLNLLTLWLELYSAAERSVHQRILSNTVDFEQDKC